MSTPIDHRPEELPAVAVELLEGVLRHLSSDQKGSFGELLISVHGKNMLRLAQDVIFLESHGRSDSTPIIARAVLESLFKLGVATKNPDLAARKTLLEFEWYAIQQDMPGSGRDVKKIRQKQEYNPIGQRMEDLGKRWGFPEKEYLDFSKYTTWEWAKEAGLALLYKEGYAVLSNHSHAVSAGFIAPAGRAYVLAVVTFFLLEASERVAARFKIDIPKELHERIAGLRSAFMSFYKAKEYERLFAQDMFGPATPRPSKPTDKFKDN